MQLPLINLALGLLLQPLFAADYPLDQRHYWKVVQSIFRKHCPSLTNLVGNYKKKAKTTKGSVAFF